MSKKSKKIYRGFDLKSITWGYRDRFKKVIDDLYDEKLLGKENKESTEAFFNLLKKGTQHSHSCFDHVLNNFICSLNPGNNWILRIPSLFSDWTSFGSELAEHKLYMGLGYFEVWGRGGFGQTPEDVSFVMDKARWLTTIEFELAYHFIQSYQELRRFLNNQEIEVFIEHTLVLFNRHPENAYNFLQLKTKTAKTYTQIISKEARLSDCKDRLTNLARGITGHEIEIGDFTQLDSDDLIERGSSLVSVNKWLYLPAKVSFFPTRKENIEHYMLITAVASAGLFFQSFNLKHGQVGANTCLEYIKKHRFKFPELFCNIFILFETFRILQSLEGTFPGINIIFKTALNVEIENHPIFTPADEMAILALKKLVRKRINPNPAKKTIIGLMEKAAQESASFTDVLSQIKGLMNQPKKLSLFEKYFSQEMRPLSFYPDYLFPSTISEAPESLLGADLKNKEKSPEEEAEKTDESMEASDEQEITQGDDTSDSGKKEKSENKIPVGYFYDEWNQLVNDYYENWCCLKEREIPALTPCKLNEDYQRLSKQVKRVFEKLKPDQAAKEKYLQEGDFINIDMLIEHLSLQKAKIFDKVKFYEKPYIKKRDLTVAVLIDMSGSTGEEVIKGKKIIDLEKNSAYILGEGLAEIGDNFGIFGFSGSGRENAEYFVIKDFKDKWNENAKDSLFSATPKSSTRIGVALRHTGYKLAKCPTRQKLIILITDGKPMDSHYEHTTRYAQYDVRKANDENYRAGIDSFCISTEENQIEDLEIMFPFHRYVIIKSMVELPKILSQFYLNITK